MEHFPIRTPSVDGQSNDERRLLVLAQKTMKGVVSKTDIVAHKDLPLYGFNDLDGDDLVIEGLQDLDRGI